MRKSILTFFIISFCTTGLFAQNKKVDSALKAKAKPTILTHKDSAAIKNAMKNRKPSSSNSDRDTLIVPARDIHKSGINDVIDVEHQIK